MVDPDPSVTPPGAQDGARLVLDVPAGEADRVLAALGLRQDAATRVWSRLFEHAAGGPASPLYLRRATVLSLPGPDGATRTSIRLWRVRRRLLADWRSSNDPGAGERLRVVQEWRGQMPSLAATLTAVRSTAETASHRQVAQSGTPWDLVLTPAQRHLLEAGTGIELDAGRAVPLGPLEQAAWRQRRGGVLLAVRRWRAGRLDALDISYLALATEAPFLRAAVRSLAAELALDPEPGVEPLDLRAAAQLWMPGQGLPADAR